MDNKLDNKTIPKKNDIFRGVTLSLISHTNIGKTTLARTLLRQDIGEVMDKAHVTDESSFYNIVENENKSLRLWDTPGFGDTAKLLKRLKKESQPLSWVVTQLWDRFNDRALWSSQQAVKNIKNEADIVLYLINASESPEESIYVDHEIQIIQWMSKPVIVILNQTNLNESHQEKVEKIKEWDDIIKKYDVVKHVIHLDAFTRCWVQEHELLNKIEFIFKNNAAHDNQKHNKIKIFKELANIWKNNNYEVYDKSVEIFSKQLVESITDGVHVSKESIIQKIGIGRGEINSELKNAKNILTKNLANRLKKSTDEVIKLNGIKGSSIEKLSKMKDEYFGIPDQVDESIWTAIGGLASGISGGLLADLTSGGMTFGGGAILGGIGGGTASYFLAKSLNLTTGSDNRVRWSKAHFREQFQMIILTYLAIAHYGRGQGNWQESNDPKKWREKSDDILSKNIHWKKIKSLWQKAESITHQDDKKNRKLFLECEKILKSICNEILHELYPEIDF